MGMKGLKEYIKKHGRHFTVDLAYRIIGDRWKAKEVYDYLQKKVYYNINGTTLGDMVYLFNNMYESNSSKQDCRKSVISYVQDIGNLDNPFIFEHWVSDAKTSHFDITPYV